MADPVLALEDEVGRRRAPHRPRRARSRSARTRARDSSGSKTGRSCSVRGLRRRRASRRVARSGAAMRASGSAWCWISPPSGTRIGWSRLDRADDVLAGDVGRGHDHDRRPVERRVEIERDEPARARRSSGSSRRTRRPGRRGRRCTARLPVSLAGPSRRSGAARPGARTRERVVPGRDDERASGTVVRVVMPDATIPSARGWATSRTPLAPRLSVPDPTRHPGPVHGRHRKRCAVGSTRFATAAATVSSGARRSSIVNCVFEPSRGNQPIPPDRVSSHSDVSPHRRRHRRRRAS